MHTGPSDTALCNSPVKCARTQLGQIQEIKAFIAAKTPAGEDWLFEGDLNVDSQVAEDPEKLNYPEVGACHMLAVALAPCLSHALLHSAKVMGESLLVTQMNSPSTYPVPKEGGRLVNSFANNTTSCLDHVFTNISSARMAAVLFDELLVDGIWLSDHAALAVSVGV